MTIRRVPTDFVVEEFAAPEARAAWLPPEARGAHAVYELTKISMTTPDACAGLAKAIGLKGGAADYAGLKDRHARTVQHLSLPWKAGPARPPAEVSGRGWSARLVGWSGEPVSAACIAFNRFTIRVRDLTPEASAEMSRRAGLLAEGDGPALRVWVINYFGDQRFGSARHGRGFVARRLIEGDFEGALRLAIGTPARKDAPRVKQARRLIAERWGEWKELAALLAKGAERRVVERLAAGGDFREAFAALPSFDQAMAVEAYQSHLWNGTARRLAEGLAPAAPLLRAADVFGEMVFPPAAVMTGEFRRLEVPMLAAGTRLEGAWADSARAVLAEEGIGVDLLRIPGLRRPAFGEAWRPLVVAADRFELGEAGPDELSAGGRRRARTVRFDLPRGAYATVVLRALGQ